jgi:selenocysteine lyase/cysteine desulfurase
VRPAADDPPAVRFETGTPSFEAQAGVLGTIAYLEWLGREVCVQPPNSRRAGLLAAMAAIARYERTIGERALAALRDLAGARLYGLPTMDGRVPTFAFTIDGQHPGAIAAHLARHRIHVWSGHFYAVEPVRRLGLLEKGGLVRVGLCHYSTADELDRLFEVLRELR